MELLCRSVWSFAKRMKHLKTIRSITLDNLYTYDNIRNINFLLLINLTLHFKTNMLQSQALHIARHLKRNIHTGMFSSALQYILGLSYLNSYVPIDRFTTLLYQDCIRLAEAATSDKWLLRLRRAKRRRV